MKKLIFSLAFLLMTFFANADTIYVDDDNLGYFNDLQPAIDSSGSLERIVSETLSGANTIPQVKLLASDGSSSDYFGYSVSIDGDYVIIGADFDDDKGDNSGSAYIFKCDGSGWSQQAKLTALDGAAGDSFGMRVSINGDYTIVGAREDDDKGTNSGSAYIFKRNGDNWSQQAKLTALDGAPFDYFGTSVSIDGDYVVIGAFFDDDKGTNSGSAYIFKRDGSNWSQQAKLTASDGSYNDLFGTSVSIDGNYAVIGASWDDSITGSAYIFERNGDNWSQQAKLTASDASEGDHFGGSISIDGDYAIAGSDRDDANGFWSGSAYIFKRDGTNWSQQAKLTASDGAAYDCFGCSVSIDGNYAVIGAYWDDDKGSGSGSAYIFKCNSTNWLQQAKLTASDGAAGDRFGGSVSIDGDYAIASATGDDDKGDNSGSAYICGSLNTPPVADAGGDQTIYAPTNALTDVTLDGSGSYDPDGDELTYIWKVDGQIIGSDGIINMLDYAAITAQLSDSQDLSMCLTDLEPLFEAWLSTPTSPDWDPEVDVAPTIPTGAIITIQLPAGEHIIELIVYDGFDDSEPNYAIVTVVPPVQADAKFTPQSLNCDSHGNYVKAHFTLPDGFVPEDINTNTPVVAELIGPAELVWIDSLYINVFINNQGLVCIEAVFARADFCNILPSYGYSELMVYGLLNTGQYFCSSDTIQADGSPPTPAYNPDPANGATYVNITADLSWSAGSNTGSHDVYFGTANPPPFIGNQISTTFDPCIMDYDTTYYWQIDEVGPGGTTTGALWSFTTEPTPIPGQAYNPSPADSAIDISIIADLSFSAGPNTNSHDVYFGTANPPPFIGNQTSTTYDPCVMDYETTYYWQIDEVGSYATTGGQLWSFTTEPIPMPSQASNPAPADGATDVGLNADLSWSAGSFTTSHDVYFGTANPPPFVGNQTATTFEPGLLDFGTTYYWQIDEVGPSGTTLGQRWSFTTEAAPDLWALIKQRLSNSINLFETDPDYAYPSNYPRSTYASGVWKPKNEGHWASGFWPGSLWYLYQKTGEQQWKDWAIEYTLPLERHWRRTNDHESGFLIYRSFGLGYHSTANPSYIPLIAYATASMLTRFDPVVGCIRSWNSYTYPVITDGLMMLEMVFWAAEETGISAWYDMAVTHAEKTMENNVRPNGSTWQIVDYDPATGDVLGKYNKQGYNNDSTWSRGQAWGIYGFTMVYRETLDSRFLDTAKRCADYFIDNLPADFVPYWDFNAPYIPNEPKDSSAAAIAASGLLELSSFVTDQQKKQKYYNAACDILDSLSSSAYLATDPNMAILMHGTGRANPTNPDPGTWEIDCGLIYGDHFFIEALLRRENMTPP